MLVESMKVTKEPEVEHKLTYGEMRSRAEKIGDAKLKERVLTGLLLLQERWGDDWVDHINPHMLSMSSSHYCVLGQLYGNYATGLKALQLLNGVEFGFEMDRADVNRLWKKREYKELDKAWKSVIA